MTTREGGHRDTRPLACLRPQPHPTPRFSHPGPLETFCFFPVPTSVNLGGGWHLGHLLHVGYTHSALDLCTCVFLCPAETSAPNYCPQNEKSEKIMKDWKGEVGVREPLSGGQRPGKRKRCRGATELRQSQIQAWIHPKSHPPFQLKPPSLGLCCFFNTLPSPSLKRRLLLELPEDSFLPCTHTKTPDQRPCSVKNPH